MVRKASVIMFFVLLIICLSFLVKAVDTPITVSTLANYDIEISILDPYAEESNLLNYFENNTGESGKVSVTFSTSKNKVDIVVIIRKYGKFVEINGETIHKFEGKTVGEPINIEIIPKVEEPPEIKNETEGTNITEATIIEETPEETQQGGITGEAISEESSFNITNFNIKEIFSSTLFYILGAIILVLIAVFVVFKTGLIKLGDQSFKTRKYSEIKGDLDKKGIEISKGDISVDEKSKGDLSFAEEKLKEVQEEIERLKKIQDTEKKIKECKKELEKLRGA